MKPVYRITALALAFILCIVALCGCGSLSRAVFKNDNEAVRSNISVGDAGADYDVDIGGRRIVEFADMEYKRPDIDALVQRLSEIRDLLAGNEDETLALELAEETEALTDSFSSMAMLAIIHSDRDKSDTAWLVEERYVMEGTASVDLEYELIRRSLYDSDHRQAVQAALPDFFLGVTDTDFITEETKPLYEREAMLVSEYKEKMATAAIDIDGKTLTYADIRTEANRSLALKAYTQWFEEYNPLMGGIYVELVSVRNEIAKSLGFESYTDMGFTANERDYDADMAMELIDNIVEFAVPVYKEMIKKGFSYNPQVEVSYEEFLLMAEETLGALSGDFMDAFYAMLEYGLCDWDQRAYKSGGAYTAYIADYDAPFTFGTYRDSANSIATFVHEFGHFNDAYTNESDFIASLDTAEIFSQALELLFSNYYFAYFDAETAYQMWYDVLSSGFSSMVTQPYYTALELRVYALSQDELTLEAVNEIADEEARRFGLYAAGYQYSMYDWVTISHIFEAPFYTIAYATSMDIAMQIWQLYLEDYKAAVETYFELLDNSHELQFVELVENAGLTSPFEESRVEELAELIEVLLYEEDWSGGIIDWDEGFAAA